MPVWRAVRTLKLVQVSGPRHWKKFHLVGWKALEEKDVMPDHHF